MKTGKASKRELEAEHRAGPELACSEMGRPLRESIIGEYKRHLDAAMQAGETCSCLDVKYMTDLLDVMLRDGKWPTVGSERSQEAK